MDFKHGQNYAKEASKVMKNSQKVFSLSTLMEKKREFWLASPLVLKEHGNQNRSPPVIACGQEIVLKNPHGQCLNTISCILLTESTQKSLCLLHTQTSTHICVSQSFLITSFEILQRLTRVRFFLFSQQMKIFKPLLFWSCLLVFLLLFCFPLCTTSFRKWPSLFSDCQVHQMSVSCLISRA